MVKLRLLLTLTKVRKSELSISQQEILHAIEIWIAEGSGWTIDKIDSNYSSFNL